VPSIGHKAPRSRDKKIGGGVEVGTAPSGEERLERCGRDAARRSGQAIVMIGPGTRRVSCQPEPIQGRPRGQPMPRTPTQDQVELATDPVSQRRQRFASPGKRRRLVAHSNLHPRDWKYPYDGMIELMAASTRHLPKTTCLGSENDI
jgi:hypothetical protein